MAADPNVFTLSAADILGSKDTEVREFVACPEWGHVEVDGVRKPKGVFVRGLTLKERGIVRRMATEVIADPESPSGKRDVLDAEKLEALMVVHASCAADGRLLFARTDYEGLMERLGGPINRIAKKAMELSGMLLTEKQVQG